MTLVKKPTQRFVGGTFALALYVDEQVHSFYVSTYQLKASIIEEVLAIILLYDDNVIVSGPGPGII